MADWLLISYPLMLASLYFVTTLFVKNKSELDKYLTFYLFLVVLGEAYGVFNHYNREITGGTLPFFSFTIFFDMILITAMIVNDLGKSKFIIYSIVLLYSVLLAIFWLTPFTFAMFTDTSNLVPTVRDHLNYHQYTDFCTLMSLGVLILSFYWLYHLLDRSRLNEMSNQGIYKRYLVILAFLLFYGGTIFINAFSRFLLTDLDEYKHLFTVLFIPLYLIAYLIITISIRWDSAQ